MQLRFREDKILRMESLVNGLLTSDSFLKEQNDSLSKEVLLLQNRVDKSPEITRFCTRKYLATGSA